MGKLNMVRVDYRMVHGQIVAKWIKFRPVDRLILADDSLVDDPFMGDIYRMAVPDREVDIVGAVQNSAQRKAVVQGVALTVEEYEKLSEMKAEGVNVFLQPIPENDPVSLGSIEKKLK